MSPRIAVELSPSMLRCVVASGWRNAARRTVDVPWSPDSPEAGIGALRSMVGGVESIAVAVGLGLLRVARVELPPADDDARAGMLALESERFFATRAPVVTALSAGGNVAVAVDAVALERWCSALEQWGPIVAIDATPMALARALGRDGQGTYHVEANTDEHGVVSIRDGVVIAARRIPLAVDERPGVAPPDRDGVPGTHLAAWGALLAADESPGSALASAERRRRLAARRRRRLGVAVVAALAGLSLAVTAADRWREGTWRALEVDVATRRDSAAAGEAALAAHARLDAEVAVLARAAGSGGAAPRGATLGALAAISNALPPDVVILQARAVGREWQLEGTAASAAALVPHLDRNGHFEDVRMLSASSRFRDGPRTRETFSIALRVRPGA
ncbi:MAG: PilN domain-containing protein [Gemmatimonadetes bacterium]|nr:PilN domain-containing protein [Gemmatimonadota bacterium]MCC6773629.1 PilN domain-containing protein [Gemmatimonadaceae bacterium]